MKKRQKAKKAYGSPKAAKIRRQAVAAVLGWGKKIPGEAEVWPFLEERNEGSYVSGDLIVLCGTDAEWAEELQGTISQMVGDQKSQEDAWKMAIALLARERIDKSL